MKRLLLVLILLGLVAEAAWAQRTVTGKVTSATDGIGVPGASVLLKGSTQGVVTDVDGNYRIEVPSNESVLVFSFVGYLSSEEKVGNRSVISLALKEDVKQLQEIVVVGYGVQERRELTGSVTSIDANAISNLVSPSFESQLAGRAAGVQVTTPSGLIGQTPVIRIRGTNSITSGAGPLIVIDGVPAISSSVSAIADINPLSNINPADIESYQVLKDGSATAIYGSRAANGVILITTKRGKKGAGQVDYNFSAGQNEAVKRFDLLSGDEFVTIANEKFTNAGNTSNPAKPGVNTNWQDHIYRKGFVQNHNLSLKGGSDATTYFFSLGYSAQEAPILANDLTKYSFRANVDHKIKDFINIGTNLSYSNSTINSLNNGENSLSGAVLASTRMLPNVSVYDPENTYFGGFNITSNGAALGQGENSQVIDNNYPNIAFVLANNKYRTKLSRIMGSAYGEVALIEGLKARTQFGVDIIGNDDFLSWDPRHGDGRGRGGYAYQAYRPTNRWNWQNTLNYIATFGANHNLNVTVGQEYQFTESSGFNATGQGFADRFFQNNNIITGAYNTQTSGGYLNEQGFESYFGRVNYNFRGRYLLSFTMRNDAISSLPENTRRGTFPGGSIGWRVSDENFWVVKSVVNDFKVRASYAEVGNVDVGYFPYAGIFTPVLYGSSSGVAFSNVGNNDLRWEASKKTNVGFDMSFLNSRINVSADWFKNNVEDMILEAPVAPSFGVPGNTVTMNVGAMVNQGVEARIAAEVLRLNKFSWNTDVNFTSLRNEVTNLVSPLISSYHITRVGDPIGMLYGVEWAGVNPQNGNAMYYKYDEEGQQYTVQYNTADGKWYKFSQETPETLGAAAAAPGASDFRPLGNTAPKWMGGWTNNFTYGGFDLEVFLRYSGGNYIMNETGRGLLGQGFSNNGREILGRWTEAGQVTDVPKLYAGSDAAVYQTSVANSRFVEKGDFLRVQNIVLGYKLPTSMLENATRGTFRAARVFAQLQNPFTFTKYSGLDPELNSRTTNNREMGLDFNSAPLIRTYSVGLSVSL